MSSFRILVFLPIPSPSLCQLLGRRATQHLSATAELSQSLHRYHQSPSSGFSIVVNPNLNLALPARCLGKQYAVVKTGTGGITSRLVPVGMGAVH